MGVMNKMRDNMAGIMIFLVIVFVLTMSIGGLVGGADITDLLGGKQPNAFTLVNGEELTRESFMRALQNERDGYRKQNGSDPSEQQMAQLTDQIWETMVTQILIRQEIEKQGLTVSPEELRYFFTENIHPTVRQYFTDDAGNFDFNAYQEAVNAPEAANFFAAMRQQVAGIVPVEKLQQKVLGTAQVSEAEVRAEFVKANIPFDLDYIFIRSSLWKDNEVEVSDAEIENYYDLNLEDFQQDETRSLQYVSYEIKPSATDTTRAFNRNKDLKTDLLKGAAFDETARLNSEGPSAPNGGYLGWFGKGKMAAPFEEAAFAAKVGDIVGPVVTQFGLHLIKVEATRVKDGQPEVEARHILIEVRPSETTRDKLRRELKNLEFMADEVGFNKAADSLGFELKTSNKLKARDTFISGLGSFQSAVRFAYLSEIGDHSKVMQNTDHFGIFVLESIDPAGPRPLEQAKVTIKRRLTNEKKQALAKAAADELRSSLTADGDWSTAAVEGRDALSYEEVQGALQSTGIKGLGRYPQIYGYLETADFNTVSPVFDTPRGSVIVRLKGRGDFDEVAYAAQHDELFQKLMSAREGEIWSTYLADLKENAKIVDNRLRML